MKKRFISALVSVAIMFSLAITVTAATTPEFTMEADAESVDVGETISVQVGISNNPDIASIQADIIFETELLVCTKMQAGSVLNQNGILYADNENNSGKSSFAAASLDPIQGNGTLSLLTFECLAAGEATVSMIISGTTFSGEEIAPVTKKITFEIIGNSTVSTETSGSILEPPADSPANEKLNISFSDVPETHWAYSYIQNVVKQGLFTGISNNQFGPDMNVTRGMFVTVLYSNAGAPTAEPSTFSDVSADAWYSKCVSWASEQGIVSGIGDNKFGPELSITREQLALILYQYAKGTSPGTEAYVRMFYPDGKDIHDWALTAMSWAVNEGLISGKTGNRLAPQDTATRAEVAVIMQNFVNLTK